MADYMLSKLTFDAFLELAEKRATDCRGNLDSRCPENISFYGETFRGAMHLAVAGWKEGRERISEARSAIEDVGENLETMTHDVAGSEPDVGRYLAGEPENMLAFIPTDERHTIRILACISISGAIEQEVVFTRGAAVVALADRLERQGDRVEVVLCDCSQPSNGATLPGYAPKSVTLVQIKRAGEPMDVDRMAFLFAHRASQRRLMFSVKEHVMKISACNRRPSEIPAEIRDGFHVTLPEADSSRNEWSSPAAAARWIDAQVCRFTPAPEEA